MTHRVAVVTGGASGIGLGIAQALIAAGDRVAIWDVDETALGRLPEILEEAGDRVFAQQVDVTSADQVTQAVDDLAEQWHIPDILVNNAGLVRDKRLHNMSEEDWDIVISVNLKSQFLCSKAVLPGMVERASGRIINISSRAWLGGFGQANYSAAKGGVISLTRSLAIEFASKGVTVNAVAPGIIVTPLLQTYSQENRDRLQATVPMKRIGETADVAAAVMFFASEAAAYITGQTLYVCGGRSLSSPNV